MPEIRIVESEPTVDEPSSESVEEATEDSDVSWWESDETETEWESSDDSDEEIYNRMGAPTNLFELIDTDNDNKVNVFEFFSMFVQMDTQNDFQVSPEELIWYMLDHKDTICRPYAEIITLMMGGN